MQDKEKGKDLMRIKCHDREDVILSQQGGLVQDGILYF